MDAALHELPLAIFTTLAPLGAGAFIVLACAFAKNTFTDTQLKQIDKFTIVPLLIAVVGLLASFFHLTNPLNAINVANTIGATPMANEITVFGTFMIVAAVYWILAVMGKMTLAIRKVYTLVLAVFALIVACMIGAAYLLATVPSWNTPLTVVAFVGFLLFGGSISGLMVLSLAGVAEEVMNGEAGKLVVGAYVAGFILAFVGVVGLYMYGSMLPSAMIPGSVAAASVAPLFGIFVVLSLLGAVAGWFACKIAPALRLIVITWVVIALAVFCARLVFYGMQIGIGL